MAEKKLSSVPDPIFNDFLYTVMYNLNATQKRTLHGKYLKAVMSEKSAKSFIMNATDEDKKIILAAAGLKFYWVFSKETTLPEHLRDMLNKFQEDRKVAALKDIAHQSAFVTSDKEYIRLLGLMSASIHQPSFYFDLSLLKTGFHLRKWKKRFVNPVDMEAREVDESAMLLARTLLSGMIVADYMKGVVGLTVCEVKLLLYLYVHPHLYISEKHLYEFFKGSVRNAEIRTAIRSLFKSGHIEGDGKAMDRSYTITGAGVKKINEYFKVVFTKLNF